MNKNISKDGFITCRTNEATSQRPICHWSAAIFWCGMTEVIIERAGGLKVGPLVDKNVLLALVHSGPRFTMHCTCYDFAKLFNSLIRGTNFQGKHPMHLPNKFSQFYLSFYLISLLTFPELFTQILQSTKSLASMTFGTMHHIFTLHKVKICR